MVGQVVPATQSAAEQMQQVSATDTTYSVIPKNSQST